jgi:hypothetical protein
LPDGRLVRYSHRVLYRPQITLNAKQPMRRGGSVVSVLSESM